MSKNIGTDVKKTILKECLRLAKEKNKKRDDDLNRHFNFVIQENKILEIGQNRSKAPSQTLFGYPETSGIHSENDAYRKAKGLLDPNKSFEVVNIRLNKQNEIKISKPCPCCYNLIRSVGAKVIYFSTDCGFAKISLGD